MCLSLKFWKCLIVTIEKYRWYFCSLCTPLLSFFGSVRMETVAMLNVKKHKTISKPQIHPHTPQAVHKHSKQHSRTHSYACSYNAPKPSTYCVATNLSTHMNTHTCTHMHSSGIFNNHKTNGITQIIGRAQPYTTRPLSWLVHCNKPPLNLLVHLSRVISIQKYESCHGKESHWVLWLNMQNYNYSNLPD